MEAPPLSPEFVDDTPANMDPSKEDDAEVEVDGKPRASWLDALSDNDPDRVSAERVSTFNPDDNGLYRMYLPETV